MPISFDDLVPEGAAAPPPQTPAKPKLSFDDLVPEPKTAGPTEASSGLFGTLGDIGRYVVGGALGTAGSALRGIGAQSLQRWRELAGLPQEGFDAKDSWIAQAGSAVERAGRAVEPRQSNVPEIGRDIARGVGSVGTNIAAFTAHPLLGIVVALGQGQGEALDRAIQAGATPDQQVRAANLGTVAGATEFVDALLPSLGTLGRVASVIVRVGLRILEGAFVEGGQEGVQQLIQNAIARGIYDPNQPLTQDVAYNALIGAIVGGGVTGVLGGRERGEEATKEAVDRAFVANLGSEEVTGSPLPADAPPQSQEPPLSGETPSAIEPSGQGRFGFADEPAPRALTAAEAEPVLNELDQVLARRETDQVLVDQGLDPINGTEGLVPRTNVPWYRPRKAATHSEVTLHETPPPDEWQDEVRQNPSGYKFYSIEQGGQPVAVARFMLHGDGTSATLAWVGRRYEKGDQVTKKDAGTLGPRVMRESLRQFAAANPQITELSAFRISGARRGKEDIVFSNESGRLRLLSEEEVAGSEVAPAVLSEIAKRAPGTFAAQQTLSEIAAQAPREQALRDEIQARPGVEVQRLAKLLGPKLYGDPSNIASVSVKEMLQNSFDAVKAAIERGIRQKQGLFGLAGKQDVPGLIDIVTEPKTRTISIVDNGIGMSAETLAGPFLRIAGTQKEGGRASGGLGIAKMLFLYGNQNVNVVTLRNGKVAELNATGEQLFSSLDDPKLAPRIQVRSPTSADLKLFPAGHGTAVRVVVPETYRDPATGEQKGIEFPVDSWSYPVLENSPLFANINVRFNGQDVNIGSRFDSERFTRFADVKFDWGDARIYITKNPVSYAWNNVKVLSNGLWQFSLNLTKDGSPYGDAIPYDLFIDVSPNVRPEDAGYPFDLNRQGFSSGANNGFAQILRYIALQYQAQDFQDSVANFGDVEYLTDTGSSGRFTLVPTKPPETTAIARLHEGDKVEIVDGQLVVRGKKVPEITPDMLREANINFDELRIDQSEISPDEVMLHDNVDVQISSVESRTIVELGREKFGKRFDSYMHQLGLHFQEFRASMMALVNAAGREATYAGMMEGGIGISFDTEYRGVSIRIPFQGIFLNPALPKFKETPELTGVSFAMTMLHEFAHHDIRTEDNPHKREMEELLVLMDVNPDIFQWSRFKSELAATVRANWDVQQFLTGVFSGAVDLKPRGRRLKGVGDQSGRNESSAANVARSGAQRAGESGVSQGLGASSGVGATEQGPANVSRRDAGARDSDNGASANRAAFDEVGNRDTPGAPVQPETRGARKRVRAALGGTVPARVREAAGHADRMNKFYKWTAGLHQLVALNPHFRPLVEYYDQHQRLTEMETKVHDPAIRISKDWRALGAEGDRLSGFLDELVNMTYLSEEERKRGLARWPTEAERNALVAKYKLTTAGLQVFTRIRTLIEKFNQLVEQNAVNQAKDLAEVTAIRAQGKLLRERPYFPFMRHGELYLYVQDAAGKVVHFETVERRGLTSAKRVQEQRRRALEAAKEPGHEVFAGVLPESAGPLVGMPPLLLKHIGSFMQLSPEQLTAIKWLQQAEAHGLTPVLSSRYQRKFYVPGYGVYTPGYSMDFKRSFAKYFFHGAKFLAKTTFIPQMEATVNAAEKLPGIKEGYIHRYMRDHLDNNVKDARGDYGYFKGFIFLWALGYSPAAATQNLTQIFLAHNWMSAKFGDAAATKALASSFKEMSNYYKRGKYLDKTSSDFYIRAFGEAIEARRITETQAAELAGLAQGNNLIVGLAGTWAHRQAINLFEKSAWMFEMAEQWNRRTTYRAALDLALKYPNAKAVQEALKVLGPRVARLEAKGFSEAQARAIVTALYTVDQTQFVYERGARPRYMRGRLPATVFVFQQYVQSLLYTLGTNRSDMLWRYLITAGILGGLGGLPGYEELEGILKAVGARVFGKRWNAEEEIRRYVNQWFDGSVPPDLILHGLARRGFGIPALLDSMGALFTGQPGRGLAAPRIGPQGQREGFGQNVPFPVFDRSAAIGVRVLPFDIGALAAPGQDVDRAIAEQGQKASGAVFSVGFNLYRFLNDSQQRVDDPKRWERIMPRALRSASQSFRAFNEGRDRTKGGPAGGSTVISYDTRDPEQFAEAVGLALGYQSVRKQARWDAVLWERERVQFYDFQRNLLLGQMFEAVKGGRKEEIDDARTAIRQFNRELPQWAAGRSISGETIQRSIQTRQRAVTAREAGVPLQKGNLGIARERGQLFPEATIDVRRVR